MKQGKKPTAVQKRLISGKGLDPNEWQVLNWSDLEATLQNKQTKEVKVLQIAK